MTKITLRDYQLDVIADLRHAALSGKKRLIVHAPTGAGKTVIASHLISLARDRGSLVLFLANRRELVKQAENTLLSCGLDCGVIMAGVKADLTKPVQIASMQTYLRRIKFDDPLYNPWFHDADLVIVDECHMSISPSYRRILKEYRKTFVIGLTATPCRADGRGLGEFYDTIVSSVDIGELIDKGHLTRVRYFVPSTPDLKKIKTVAGDYDKGQLAERVDTPKLVGDVTENWLRLAGDRQTIVFAVSVKHSQHIVESFRSHGISAKHIDAHTPIAEREDVLNRLSAGEIQIISNVGILTEGFDFPAASCIVLARPTKSMGLYLQMAGRGIRPYPGKQDCILLDHGGCVEQHGLIEWEREWSLDGKTKAWSRSKAKKKQPSAVKCRSCNLVFEGVRECPDCGSPVKAIGKKVKTVEADLKEYNRCKESLVDKRIYYGMLKWWQGDKGYSPKFINAKYQTKYGCWPHHSIKDVAPIPPDEAFRKRMLSEQIRYAKSRRKAS